MGKVIAVTITQAKELIKAAWNANHAPALVGSPGVGKTAIVRAAAKELGYDMNDVFEVIAAAHEATDFVGIPFVGASGRLTMHTIPEIRAAVERPCVLFFDELTGGAPSVQQAIMRIVLEKRVGCERLHEKTVIAAAYNPTEQTAGGVDISAPLRNRLKTYELAPSIGEIQAYFRKMGDEGSSLREEGVDFAATLSVKPDLIDMQPRGDLFASPRAWEHTLRSWDKNADVIESGVLAREDIAAGCLGDHVADAYAGIRKIRKQLPSIEEISKTPKKAKLPRDVEAKVGLAGLIARAAERDLWATWVYLGRFDPNEVGSAEAQAIAISVIRDLPIERHNRSPFRSEGEDAKEKVQAQVRKGRR